MEFTKEQIDEVLLRLHEKFPFYDDDAFTDRVYGVAIDVFIEGLKAINDVTSK